MNEIALRLAQHVRSATFGGGDLAGTSYERSGDELAGAGLYVDLGGWQFHLFRLL